jgi:TatD DNase family protein
MLIDTHCHLNMIIKEQFNTPLSPQELMNAGQCIQEAEQADVLRIITIGTSIPESYNCIKLAQQFSSVYAAVGIHPTDATEAWHDELTEIKKMVHNEKVVAIGECGLDFHQPNYHVQLQKDVFKAQIELALENNLALIIHTRDAYDETMRIIEEYKNSLTRVVMHCFSEGCTAAQEVIAMGFLLGIGGPITYPKNNTLREVVSIVGLDHIMLETDAPFLPPQIIRGKKNEPKYIAAIAHYLAQHLQLSYQEVADKTTANAQRLFGIQ